MMFNWKELQRIVREKVDKIAKGLYPQLVRFIEVKVQVAEETLTSGKKPHVISQVHEFAKSKGVTIPNSIIEVLIDLAVIAMKAAVPEPKKTNA